MILFVCGTFFLAYKKLKSVGATGTGTGGGSPIRDLTSCACLTPAQYLFLRKLEVKHVYYLDTDY